jgi:hypothetical protein
MQCSTEENSGRRISLFESEDLFGRDGCGQRSLLEWQSWARCMGATNLCSDNGDTSGVEDSAELEGGAAGKVIQEEGVIRPASLGEGRGLGLGEWLD